MTEIRVTTWNDLHERLYEGTWQKELGRFRGTYAYRGMSRSCNDLRTSLMRLGLDGERQEAHLLRNFRKYATRDAVGPDSIWNWLAVAQHHCLPTRLLDWSFSPLVAAHFATEELEAFDEDGIIWRVDYIQAHQLLPKKLRAALDEENADLFTAEMLTKSATSLSEFDDLEKKPFVVFFEPPSLDDRIVNQFAIFSLMSGPSARLDEWLRSHPELCQRVIIPAPVKWEVRDKLDQANITERVLFPGLDGLSRWLKRYYTPKA